MYKVLLLVLLLAVPALQQIEMGVKPGFVKPLQPRDPCGNSLTTKVTQLLRQPRELANQKIPNPPTGIKYVWCRYERSYYTECH